MVRDPVTDNDKLRHSRREKDNNMQTESIKSPTTVDETGGAVAVDLQRLVRRLYDARQSAAAAKKARAEKAAELGDCENFYRDDPENNGNQCYNTQQPREKWCDVCKAKQPFYEDYQHKSAMAGAALAAVLRAGKSLPPNVRVSSAENQK
jgi:hypothetical protein